MHGFITRDGVPPTEFAAVAREELTRYPNIHFLRFRVEEAYPEGVTDSPSDWMASRYGRAS